MRVLILGGSGLISTGIVKHLQARGAEITMFNRGKRSPTVPAGITQLIGDRDDAGFVSMFENKPFDVVIDMICFSPKQADDDVRAFGGSCEHFIFCSTVCTYGIDVPPNVRVDESFPQQPISGYGKNKLICEQTFLRADESGDMNVTVIRPSHTYGPGGTLIDNLEGNAVAWDRIERGLPVLCSGDGLGLWNSTHRDDVGKLFAYAAMNSTTFGKCYNATIDRAFTWRDYYREAAQPIGKPANLLFMPATWIVSHDATRFNLLKEITGFHGVYDSSAAKRDVPEFSCDINFIDGAAQTLADLRQRGAWRDSRDDAAYDAMVDKALHAGVLPVEA